MTVAPLGKAAYLRLLLAWTLVSLLLFLPAESVRYWEAWQCLAMMLIAASLMVAYLLKTRPNLLERRLRMREKELQQQ